MSTSQLRPAGEFVFNLNIDQQSVRDFSINLVDWSQRNNGAALRINVNSSGGTVLEALSLFDLLQHLRTNNHHLTIAAYGRAASCAAFLLQAADVRIIGQQSWLLIHQVSSNVSGSISVMQKELERCIQLNDQTIEILCSRTGDKLTSKMIHDRIDDGSDWWITAKQALELGLVDHIEERKPFDVPSAAPSA